MDVNAKRAIVKAAKERIDLDQVLTDKERGAAKTAVEDTLKGVLPDNPLYRTAVISVAAIAILLVVGSLLIILSPAIAGQDGAKEFRKVPEFFAVAMGAAIGALAGMLANSSK